MDQSESMALSPPPPPLPPRLSSATAHDLVAPGGSSSSQDSTASVEYLLERQCRIVSDASPTKVSAKDTGEKGDGSDSGVEFGIIAAVPSSKRFSGEEVTTTTASNLAATTARGAADEEDFDDDEEDDLQGPRSLSDDIGEDLLPASGLIRCRVNNKTGGGGGGVQQQREAYAAEGQYSCDSSMLSFCSDDNLLSDTKTSHCGNLLLRSGGGGGDCASEGGGSESSSVYNHPVMTMTATTTTTSTMTAAMTMSAKKRSLANGFAFDDKAKNMSMSTTQLSRPETLGRAKFRASSVNRVGPPALLTKDRARSRDRGGQLNGSPLVRANSVRRPPKPDSLSVSSPMTTSTRRLSTLGRTQSVRTPGTTPSDSGRWPYGPSVASAGGGTSGSTFSTPRSARSTVIDPLMVKTRLGQMSLDHSGAQSTFDKYATMPRRRREKTTEQNGQQSGTISSTRSSSISRDRLTTPAKLSICSTNSLKSTPVNMKEPLVTPKLRSVVRRLTQKVPIFLEKSIQTALTHQDLDNAFAGKATSLVDVAQRDKRTTGIQADIRDREMEELRLRLKHLTEEAEQMRSALGGKTILLASVEQQLIREREAKVKLQKELQCNSERVVAILESHAGTQDVMMDSTDSLMMLESRVTSDSQMVSKQKVELKKMRNVCTALRQELDEALERERSLIAERESEEMQEFLQIEKSVLTDAAKTEEKAKWQSVVEKKDQEIKWLLEECRHLVRFGEQMRQENMGMQSKYGALEMKSKELLVQQGSAVSGASVALNSLGSRLEQLVDQLIASYNISEQELEDVVFHNEAFPESGSSNGNGSYPASPDEDDVTGATSDCLRNGKAPGLSPQRSHSFINVVINAIRSATSLRKEQATAPAKDGEPKKIVPKQVERIQEEEMFASKMEDSDGSTDMLDSETEPCLMMENVLGDSESHGLHNRAQNFVGNSSVLLEDEEDQSLNNLSQAISNRQQIELQTSQMLSMSHKKSMMMFKQQQQQSSIEQSEDASSIAEDMPSLICDNCTNTQEIIEQVISVDNQITKLLKVLRIVQQDNDNCIQHLVGEKNKLQQNQTENEDKIKDCEDVNENLKGQLTTMTQHLLDTEHELNNSKSELHRCRQEIEKLNHHICELSSLCGNKENNNHTPNINECLDNGHPTKRIEDVLKAVLRYIDTTNSAEYRKEDSPTGGGELYKNIMSLLKSNRDLRAELTEQKRVNPNNMSWQLNAISDLKRLYEVIDRALEVLNAEPFVIAQHPALSQLQKDLEETNFTLANTIPSYMAIVVSLQRDHNANSAGSTTVTLINGNNNGDADNANSAEEMTSNGGGAEIDSMA